MDFRLLLPLAILSLVGIFSFFVEKRAKLREINIAMQSEDEMKATLGLLKREAGEVSLGAGTLVVPFLILTIIGSVQNWVVIIGWIAVFIGFIRLPLVHYARGRGLERDKAAQKWFLPVAPLIMLFVPFVAILYFYTIYTVVQAL